MIEQKIREVKFIITKKVKNMNITSQILYGGAIASIAILLARFYASFTKKSGKNFPVNSISQQQLENEKQLEEFRQLQKLLTEKSIDFQVEYMEGQNVLEKKCLIAFFRETMDLFDAHEIIQLYSLNREGRRSAFGLLERNYETYFKFVYTLDENIKYIIQKAQKDFAIFLNFDYNIITDSVAQHMNDREEGGYFRQQIIELMAEIRESLKNYLPLFKKPLQPKEILQIMNFQIYVLKQREEYLLQILRKIGISCEDQEQSLPIFLACFLEDTIYQKYGVEVEQLTVVNSDFNEQLISKYEQLRNIQEKITIKMVESLNRQVFQM